MSLETLTPAERRVFDLLRDPAMNGPRIAEKIGMRLTTVHSLTAAIYRKLGLTGTRSELLARYGAQDRLTDLEKALRDLQHALDTAYEELERRVAALEAARQ